MGDSTKVKVRALVSEDWTYLPLAVIETMQCIDDIDDEVANVNKLRDDLSIKVVTFTGREFVVSMQYMKSKTNANDTDKSLEQVWIDIAEQWIDIINSKGK